MGTDYTQMSTAIVLLNDDVNCHDYTVMMVDEWNKYGLPVQWYQQGKTEDLKEKSALVLFIHHTPQMDLPITEVRTLRWVASD